MGNTPQPGHHYHSERVSMIRQRPWWVGGKHHCWACKHVYRITCPDDIEEQMPEIIRALICGFELCIFVCHELVSEGPSFLTEEIISRLWELIRRRRLKRYHIRRVHFHIDQTC